MKVQQWLTINDRGTGRLTKGKPSISWDEVSVFLDINIPDEIFQRPRLEAKINIPKEAAGPDVISTEVIENVKEAIKTATGLTFSINVIKHEEDDQD